MALYFEYQINKNAPLCRLLFWRFCQLGSD